MGKRGFIILHGILILEGTLPYAAGSFFMPVMHFGKGIMDCTDCVTDGLNVVQNKARYSA